MGEARIGGKEPNQNPRMDKTAEKPEANGLELAGRRNPERTKFLTPKEGALRHESIKARVE